MKMAAGEIATDAVLEAVRLKNSPMARDSSSAPCPYSRLGRLRPCALAQSMAAS